MVNGKWELPTSVVYSLFTIYYSPFLFLHRMPAGRCYPSLGTVALDQIPNPGGLTRLRIDQLHIGNVDERLFLDDSAATIALRICLLMPLDNSHALNFYLAGCRGNFQHPTTLTLITAGNNRNLIVLLYF